MAQSFKVETSLGPREVTAEGIESLKLTFNGVEYPVVPPNIVAMFKAWGDADLKYQGDKDHQDHMRKMAEESREANAALRRSVIG